MRRRYRLRRTTDFDHLRKNGERWHHPVVMLIANANEADFSRFAFAASRRFGKATSRNRAKRLMREAVHRRMDVIKSGWDCLFIARQPANEAAFSEIDAVVHLLLKRSRLLSTESRSDPQVNETDSRERI